MHICIIIRRETSTPSRDLGVNNVDLEHDFKAERKRIKK